MAIEIERKYLVDISKVDLDGVPSSCIQQGYLSSGNGTTVRVRLSGGIAILCIKQRINDASCHEFEYEIPFEEGATMLDGASTVRKIRYDFGDGLIVDEFIGALDGLVLAEKECDSEEEMAAYEPPDWCTEDVTDSGDYYNCILVDRLYVDGKLVDK